MYHRSNNPRSPSRRREAGFDLKRYNSLANKKESAMFESILPLTTSHPTSGLLYLDPGTGSILLQILIAAGMSVLFVFGMFRKKISVFFARLFGRKPADPSQTSNASDDD
jgi:hypothetical protein